MALGIKFKKIQTKGAYTIESLYEAIKDKPFSAGRPSLVKHGLVYLIAFPALDSQNQVQIVVASTKKEAQAFQIQKADEAGVSNMAGNMILDKLTGGLFGIKKMAGKNVKEAERLVDETAKELEAMSL